MTIRHRLEGWCFVFISETTKKVEYSKETIRKVFTN